MLPNMVYTTVERDTLMIIHFKKKNNFAQTQSTYRIRQVEETCRRFCHICII